MPGHAHVPASRPPGGGSAAAGTWASGRYLATLRRIGRKLKRKRERRTERKKRLPGPAPVTSQAANPQLPPPPPDFPPDAGVREPRRPLPSSPAAALALQPADTDD